MKIDKNKMKDEKGRYITQSLFLEIKYDVDFAIYTLDGKDKEYKGKVYPSLKKLYIDFGDVTEYNFANEYLYDWEHWQRLCSNSLIMKHIEKWRDELELSIRAEGIQTILDAALEAKSYQAGKWLADKGWIEKSRGRPSNEEIEEEIVKQAKISKEFEEDFKLLELRRKDNGK